MNTSIRHVWWQAICLALAWPMGAASVSDAGDPLARVARISYLDGGVSFQPSGATDWSQATPNYPVTTGDRLYTEPGGRAALEVGPLTVRLSDTSDLTITDLTDQFMQLGLAQGTMRLSVYQLPAGDSVEVDTPNGVLSVLSAGEYRVDVAGSDSTTVVTVDSGSVEVSGAGSSQTVAGGAAVQLIGTDPLQIADVAPSAPDRFDQWSADRDRRLSASASAEYVSRVVPGYEDLDDAGRWD